MQNKYIFFRDDQLKMECPFNPLDETSLDIFGFPYLGRVLKHFEERYADKGLVIYVTVWTVHKLPSYGENVIAFIMQDEWSRSPHYLEKVHTVFHACSTSPSHLDALSYGPPKEVISNILGFIKATLSDGLNGRVTNFFKRLKGKKLAPLLNFPLGYYANTHVDFKSFDERPYFISYAGSQTHRPKVFSLPRAKTIARNRMIDALKHLQLKHPNLPIYTKTTGSFQESIETTEDYNSMMMNSKFCLIPRGANLETFRFYEAIRYGCIPIIEAHPNLPFYANAPMVKLRDWSELPENLITLVQDKTQLLELHQRVMDWWIDVCSEQKVANTLVRYMDTGKLNYLDKL